MPASRFPSNWLKRRRRTISDTDSMKMPTKQTQKRTALVDPDGRNSAAQCNWEMRSPTTGNHPQTRRLFLLKRFSTRPPNIILSDKDTVKSDNRLYRLLRASVLNPDESLLFWWLWLVTFCGLYNSWTLIAREAFPELHEAHCDLWNILDWCSDVVYFLTLQFSSELGIWSRVSW
ncbi:cyclic nucleotide-gated cation channel alpha-4 [Caerostris extrusa]|uniref:Cyclic nucleotide-gated cation channel alpha-4 n=1 Tax=Caerostris extrusa TaxID=172846 RepID=A0AAV4TBJ0_CAEEX|nr:cyclic nucleotide-gated cation channel alpha-4 [Caerostris extrusa]